MGVIAVFISILAMGLVSGASVIFFVPMLQKLSPGQTAGGLSNLWLLGTFVVSAIVFIVVFKSLMKWFYDMIQKREEKRRI